MLTAQSHDRPYLKLLRDILAFGDQKENRTGVNTLGIFGYQMRFNLKRGFPLLTTKKLHWKSIVCELIWMLEGRSNVRWLQERGVSIWDEWADENGDLGPVYGHQWRNWGGDQLKEVVERIKTHPNDRRLIVSAWNVGDIPQMRLPPCHLLYQFNVRNGQLDCQMYQRSCDVFLGVPFNIASYSLLTHIVAHITGLEPGTFIWVGGDVHIYKNHVDQVKEQLSRFPRKSPKLYLSADSPTTLEGWDLKHCVIEGYDPHPKISAPVAV